MIPLKGHIKFLFIVALILSVIGCPGTRNAYQEAAKLGFDATAKVVSEHYDAVLTELNKAKATGALSGSNLAKAQGIVKVATPLADQLRVASENYESARNAQTETELQVAISRLAIQLSSLIDLLKSTH